MKKTIFKSIKRKGIKQLIQYEKEALQNNNFFFFLGIKGMSEKTLKFDNIRVNKKKLNKSKQPIVLMSVSVDQMVTSGKFNYSDEGFKYFIGYQEGKNETVKPLFIILPQTSGYIKSFENGGKTMPFLVRNNDYLDQ